MAELAADPVTAPNSAAPAPRQGLRWWPAVAIVLLFGSLIGAVLIIWDDPQMQVLVPQLLAALGAALLAAWYLLISRAPWWHRLIFAVLLTVGLGGFFSAFRLKGVDGSFWLDFEPRWKSAATTAELTASQANPTIGIDLTTTTPHDSPQFQGPLRDGAISGVRLDTDWAARPPKEIWRQPIGEGWSAFAVVGSYAVTQEQRDGIEWTVCYEVPTGERVWATRGGAGFGATAFEAGIAGRGPRATPTVRDGRVYVYGSLGVLSCLDGATGAPIWTRDVTAEQGVTPLEWGMSSSPLVLDDAVIVTTGGTQNNALAAYDRATGTPRWAGGSDTAGYSSPSLATIAGRPQLLLLNHNTVTAHDPTSGAVLWSFDWPGESAKVTQPIPLPGDRVFVSSGYGVGCALLQIKAGADGQLTAEQIWKNKNLRTKFTNGVIRDGHVYGLDDGMLACVRLEDGKRTWKKSRAAVYGHGQILLVDDVILVQCEQPGDVVLVAADPQEHRELARLPALSGKTWNPPTLAGKYLLVRNDVEAACYELPLATP